PCSGRREAAAVTAADSAWCSDNSAGTPRAAPGPRRNGRPTAGSRSPDSLHNRTPSPDRSAPLTTRPAVRDCPARSAADRPAVRPDPAVPAAPVVLAGPAGPVGPAGPADLADPVGLADPADLVDPVGLADPADRARADPAAPRDPAAPSAPSAAAVARSA